jgi:hypothetical protein
MGDYLPVSRYYSDGAAYDKAVGCVPAARARHGARRRR